MRNFKAVLMVGVALVLGLVAVGVAAQWLATRAGSSAGKVVISARSIDIGTPLHPDMLSVVDWPSSTMPVGHFNDPNELLGRVILTGLQRGEPVLQSKLAAIGAKGGLSAVIADGKRAITVKVNEVVGVAGFALPGNHVDVLVNTQDDREKPISKIVLESVLVLAVAQEASRDDTKPRVVNAVTLELTPEQVEVLDLARSVGNLSLALRNQLDTNAASTDGARREDLIAQRPPQANRPAPTPVVAPAPAPRTAPRKPMLKVEPSVRPETVEVIKGVSKSTATL